jgi:hypothetical protein
VTIARSSSRAAGFAGSNATGVPSGVLMQSSAGSPSGSHAFHQSRTRCPRSWRVAIQRRRSGHFAVSGSFRP